MVEKRNSLRKKSFMRGIVGLIGGDLTIDCLVRDIHETGARLTFNRATSVTDDFELRIPAKKRVIQSKIVWIDECEMGVAFKALPADEFVVRDGSLSNRVVQIEADLTALKQVQKITELA